MWLGWRVAGVGKGTAYYNRIISKRVCATHRSGGKLLLFARSLRGAFFKILSRISCWLRRVFGVAQMARTPSECPNKCACASVRVSARINRIWECVCVCVYSFTFGGGTVKSAQASGGRASVLNLFVALLATQCGRSRVSEHASASPVNSPAAAYGRVSGVLVGYDGLIVSN